MSASQQLYLLEIFIDQISVFPAADEEPQAPNNKFIIEVNFGPKYVLTVKEGMLQENLERKDDIQGTDESGRPKWTRTIRVGKSYLFPSYPDLVISELSKFPLEIDMWNDDDTENQIFVAFGEMKWSNEFYEYLEDTSDVNSLQQPLTLKATTPLRAECCCRICADITVFLRLSPLGTSVITEIQELATEPEYFVFRNNKSPTFLKCTRIEGDDPNFCMVGSCYESTTLEDPDIVESAYKKIEVCTELDSCGAKGIAGLDYACRLATDDQPLTKPLETIRMGDIRGPCGNTNCVLAQKIKSYVRGLEAYKKATEGRNLTANEEKSKRKPCGQCECKDERWHRDTCPDGGDLTEKKGKKLCPVCGDVPGGEKSLEKAIKLKGQSPNQINYMTDMTLEHPELMESLFGPEFTVRTCQVQHISSNDKLNSVVNPIKYHTSGNMDANDQIQVAVSSTTEISKLESSVQSSILSGCVLDVYNAEVPTSKGRAINYFCTEIPNDKECDSNPPKPTPPCKTFDCDCFTVIEIKDTRKHYKPYCPSYKHLENCPVIMSFEEEGTGIDDVEDPEVLPYGLPPIQLGPCPVKGRPCSVPDGFARLNKVGSLPELPPSYIEAGKVCCSKEFEKIKKVLNTYMISSKESDYRCVNRWYMDTETRCCNKQQNLSALLHKSCCGSHKLP